MPVDKEAELSRVTNLRGFRYGLHDFLAEVDPDFLKAVNDTVETQYINTQTLDRKTKENAIIDQVMQNRKLISVCSDIVLSLIHIYEPTTQQPIAYAVLC